MLETDFPILPTTHGYVKGRKCESLYGDEYFSFERIPFAKPPLGELRFKAPQPAAQWSHILECFECGPKPLQRIRQTNALEGNEDCLYLNVYVKKLETEKPLPVLIYIYGGVFQRGGAVRSDLGPDYFMKENVILVTISYRTNALGFMSFKDKSLDIPGNAGLKDQLAGLKWFKENCINFNGDPNNITLFGNSSGSMSVHLLGLIPQAKNLFHKIILQSGTILTAGCFNEADDYAYRLAKENGYEGSAENEKDIYDFLLTLNAEQITTNVFKEHEDFKDRVIAFGPTFEPYETEQGILYGNPKDLVEKAWSNNIPMIIGGASHEALYYLNSFTNLFESLKTNTHLVLPGMIKNNYSPEEIKEIGKGVYERFLKKPTPEEVTQGFVQLLSLRYFWYSLYWTCLARLKYAPSVPTYLYYFSFDSVDFNFFRNRSSGKDTRGASHADELSYMFVMKQTYKLEESSREYQTIRRLISMWCSFARDASPNCLAIAPTVWTPLKDERPLKCLNIGDRLELMDLPINGDLEYWHKLCKDKEL